MIREITFDFENFRFMWDICFEVPEARRRQILEKMSDDELKHFSSGDTEDREELIEEHIEFFALWLGEKEEDPEDEMDF